MTDTTTTLPLSIPQTECSVTKLLLKSDEHETSLSFQRGTPTINLGGGILLDRDFSGSMDHNELRSFMFDDIGPRGMGGGFLSDIIIYDEADHYDKRMKDIMGPTFVISDHCRPYYEETARESQMFAYKMAHDMPYKDLTWSAPEHKPGETPRGTKPRFIGGQKKSKQQRAAMKARRKQR